MARFARIYPVYLLALLLQLPFYAGAPHGSLAVLFMVQSWTTLPSSLPGAWNYPAWTLSVEWFFYLSFPLLLALLLRIQRQRVAVAVVILLSLALDGPQSALDRTSWICHHVPLPLLRVPEFFLGMLLARIPARRSMRADRWAAVLCVAAVLLLAFNLHRFVILVIVPFAGLIWLLSQQESWLRRLLEFRPLVLLGTASYAIYILQDPIRNWIADGGSLWPHLPDVQTLIYCVVLTLVSLLVFVGVERPARRWLRSFIEA